MIRDCFVCCTAVLFAVLQVAQLAQAQSRSPVVEFAGLLGNVDVNPSDGRWELHGQTRFTTAFLPAGADVNAVLYKEGETTPVYSHPMRVQGFYGVFSLLHCQGLTTNYFFKQPGNYVLSMQADGKEMTRLPFSVGVKQSGDEFDPVRVWLAKGPWDEWACVYVPLAAGEDAIPELWIWKHVETIQARGSDVYRVQLKLHGDIVAESTASHVGGQKYQQVRLPLRRPAAKGGTPIRLKELVAQDGQYHFIVFKNDKPESVFQLNTGSGKMFAHPRQASTHQPRTEYMLPRFPGDDAQRNRAGNLFWMRRLPEKTKQAAAKLSSPQVKRPTAEDRKRWSPMPEVDPHRPFALVLTNVETRNDTMLSAGDDIIVFGTGFPKGVKYLKVGESEAREIPRGDVYNSRVFRACGKKIVLVHNTQVLLFDTQTGRTTPIPEPVISLYEPRGGLHYGNSLNAGGGLVVTVNDVTKVRDKTVIKVIDVSGPEPTIMPIKNSDYTQRQVSSVTIDSRIGIVAISSREQQAIYAAPIATLADQYKYDRSGVRGVASNQIHLAGKRVIYADQDDKLRELDLASGKTRSLSDEAFGRSGNGFVATDKKIVVATGEHFGTRYEMAVGGFGQKPRVIPGSGVKIPNTGGSLGWAGCATITSDGTVFIAGTPSRGAGVGEYLQVLTDGGWVPLRHGGDLISAIDVTCGPALLAFKHGSRTSPTMIGYATFGERVAIPDQTELVSKLDKPGKPETSASREALRDYEKAARDRIRAEIVAAIDQAEQEMIKGFIRAGSSELEAKRQARIRGNKMRKNQKLPPEPEIDK